MLTAYYDLATSPPTYDIVAFLLVAERERVRQHKDRIGIQILPGPVQGFRADKFWPFNIAERQRMLDHVAVPMARMLPSACEVAVWRGSARERPKPGSIGYACRLYGLALQVECMRTGIRPLRPPEEFARDPRLVTITLREAEHWPERNSNVPAWVDAANHIASRGYRVVVIRDTRIADHPLDWLTIDAVAARALYARGRLYRSAACNLFVNNGPAWFAMALDAPVLMLKPTVENLMRSCSAQYFQECGIEPGGQIPNSPSYQQIVWAEDTAENIVNAFDEFMGSARAAA